LTWTIVSGPIIAKTHEPFFLFNPMIGFLLAMHMLLYTTHVADLIQRGAQRLSCHVFKAVDDVIHAKGFHGIEKGAQ
jgi:hypothetical protein